MRSSDIQAMTEELCPACGSLIVLSLAGAIEVRLDCDCGSAVALV